MKKSQEITLRLSELRSKLHGILNEENPDIEKIKGLENDIQVAEARFRAAVKDEEDAKQKRSNSGGEGKARRKLENRCDLRRAVSAALQGQILDGAEREFQQERGLNGSEIPLEMIAPKEVEVRADATTNAPSNVGVSTNPILHRMFAKTAARWLGVRFDSVPTGETVYPVITAGASPSRLAKGGDHGDISAGTVASFKLSPVRSQVGYSFRHEDAMLMSGVLESALRRDMTNALADHVDKQILSGNGTAPNVNGFFSELTAATTSSTVVTYATAIGAFGSMVDGIYAGTRKDLRVLMGTTSYAKIGSVFANSGKGDHDGIERLEELLGGVRVSAHVPAASSDNQSALVAVGRDPGAAVAAMWPSVSLIRDEVTSAKTGRINLFMVSLWNFKVIREDAYKLTSFHLA